jgi:hypothetical protein
MPHLASERAAQTLRDQLEIPMKDKQL